MKVNRILGVLVVMAVMVGCGRTDVSAPASSSGAQTQAATATPLPTSTPLPTATPDFGAMVIPMPPQSTELKKGDDPIMDALIDAMGPALEQAATQEQGTVDQVTYYKTTASLVDTTTFYTQTLTDQGWKKLDINEASQPGMEFMGYEAGNYGVLVFLIDGSQLGGADTIVIVSRISKSK